MNKEKQKRLEKKGWKVGTVQEFLDSGIRRPHTPALSPGGLTECLEESSIRVGLLTQCLKEVVQAWESLPEGHHSPAEIQHWLGKKMSPKINKARRVLNVPDSRQK